MFTRRLISRKRIIKRNFVKIIPKDYKGIRLTCGKYSGDVNSQIIFYLPYIHTFRFVDVSQQKSFVDVKIKTKDNKEHIITAAIHHTVINHKKLLLNDLWVKTFLRSRLGEIATDYTNNKISKFINVCNIRESFENEWNFQLMENWNPTLYICQHEFIIRYYSSKLKSEALETNSTDLIENKDLGSEIRNLIMPDCEKYFATNIDSIKLISIY